MRLASFLHCEETLFVSPAVCPAAGSRAARESSGRGIADGLTDTVRPCTPTWERPSGATATRSGSLVRAWRCGELFRDVLGALGHYPGGDPVSPASKRPGNGHRGGAGSHEGSRRAHAG
ncbi:hypothetical protein GCM10018952_19430 [Streptosporangium vulgare]